MTLIPNTIYWQNLPSTALKPEELDRVIRPIMDTLDHYLRNIRSGSKILKAEKRNVSYAILEINLTSDLDKIELQKLETEIRANFFNKTNHIFNGKSYNIEEQIGNRNELLIEPILNQSVSEKIITNNFEAEIKVTPLEGIFIEFAFQSDEDKLFLKNAIQHYGKLIVRTKTQGGGKSSKRYSNKYLRIIRFDPDENTALIQPIELPESFKIRIEPNTSVIQKKIRAVQSFFERPKKYYYPILRLFEKFRSQSIEEDRLTIKTTIPKDEFKYLNDDRYPGVEEQREFVNIALNTPDFAILEGPPGSGKTTTILEILHQATKLNQRVIMVASTHVAVNNVLERIDEEREKGEELHIFPIRLGDESDVRGVARNYLLDYVSKKETDRIIKALKKKGKSLNSIQRDLLITLENKKSLFDSFILDMANVVCGTTIGILRYPAFDSWEFQISEPFDMLIIDEASKTTLQEFLVPALLAKKWIIIGDKMQLSPFIEEGEIKTLTNRCYIEKNFELNHQWICSEYFSAIDSNLVITDIISLKREIQEHVEYSKQEGIVIINPFNIMEEEKLEEESVHIRYVFNDSEFLKQINKILGCVGGFIDYRCFFESYALDFFDTLPLDLNLIISPRIEHNLKRKDLDLIQFLCMKQNRKLKYYKLQNKSFYREEEKVRPWVEHLSWRLKRLYELRHQANTEENEGLYAKRDEEIECLLPKWNLAEIIDLNNLDAKSLSLVINAIRIKAHNLKSENNWNQKRNIKQQLSILLSNLNDTSSFFNRYQTLLDSLNNELDKTYLFEELLWFIIKKKSKEWLLEFNKWHPDFLKDLLTYEIGNNVYDTLRIEFPSIIELLQEGLMVEPKYRNTSIYGCTVYKGYQAKREYWETREKKLTYQHRMHPDISSFIRENFYAGKQVLDPNGLNNTYNIADERFFPFRSGPHNVWYDVKGEEIGGRSYRNIKEVEKIFEGIVNLKDGLRKILNQ